jgi:hypothetical protein
MTVWVDDAVFFRRDPLSRPTSGRVAGRAPEARVTARMRAAVSTLAATSTRLSTPAAAEPGPVRA